MSEKNLIIVLSLLVVCIALFVSRKIRPDIVALLALVTISLSGILSFQEALSGFSEPMILMIALMLVISEGFSRTGISYRVGEWIIEKSGNNITRIIVLLMLAVGILGSAMSTTAIIAIFLPITLNLCTRLKISPSILMMPLAFAGIISGMMTLVATTPNMIMSAILENETGKGFGFFSITPIGIIILILGILYMLYAYKFLDSSKGLKKTNKARDTIDDYVRDYCLRGKEYIFRINKNSPLIGKSIRDSELRSKYSLNILCLERIDKRKRILINPVPDTNIRQDDILYTDRLSRIMSLQEIREALGVSIESLLYKNIQANSMQIGMVEIAVQPESEYIGRTLTEIKFRNEFGLHAIGLRRNGKAMSGNIATIRLKVGDLILVVGPQNLIRRIFSNEIGFMVVSIPAELSDMATAPDRAKYALLSMGIMIFLMVFNIVENALAALIACLLMIFFKCLTVEAAYKAIKMPTIILIACMMPFAMALEKSGAGKIAAEGLYFVCASGGPHAMLAGLFALTMFTGLFMSNSITPILMGPVAIASASMLGVSLYPFAMAVALAASTAFMSPLSTAVNLLVWEPGRYSFKDFMKIGLPFSIIVMLVCVFIIPILFPF